MTDKLPPINYLPIFNQGEFANDTSITYTIGDGRYLKLVGGTMLGGASINWGSLNNNTPTRNLVLYDAGSSSTDFQYYGFGTDINLPFITTLTYSTPSTTADHVWFAATGAASRNELFRIKGNGVITTPNGSTFNLGASGNTTQLNIWGSSNHSGIATFNNQVSITNATNATSASTGSLVTAGGIGIGNSSDTAPTISWGASYIFSSPTKHLALYDYTSNNYQYYGFGIGTDKMTYNVGSSSNDHVFYCGYSSSSSTELFRIKGTGDATLTGSLTTGASIGIAGSNILNLNYNSVTKESNAGQIGYQVFSGGLDIVGAGTTTNYQSTNGNSSRRLTIFAEGGTTINGGLYIGTGVANTFGTLANGLGISRGLLTTTTSIWTYGEDGGITTPNGAGIARVSLNTSTSDMRIKQNIVDYDGLDLIAKYASIRTTKFRVKDKFKGLSMNKKSLENIGIIAQEVIKIFPEWIHQESMNVCANKDTLESVYLEDFMHLNTVNINTYNTVLLVALCRTIQDLQKNNTDLQKSIDLSNKSIDLLSKRLDDLEKKTKP